MIWYCCYYCDYVDTVTLIDLHWCCYIVRWSLILHSSVVILITLGCCIGYVVVDTIVTFVCWFVDSLIIRWHLHLMIRVIPFDRSVPFVDSIRLLHWYSIVTIVIVIPLWLIAVVVTLLLRYIRWFCYIDVDTFYYSIRVYWVTIPLWYIGFDTFVPLLVLHLIIFVDYDHWLLYLFRCWWWPLRWFQLLMLLFIDFDLLLLIVTLIWFVTCIPHYYVDICCVAIWLLFIVVYCDCCYVLSIDIPICWFTICYMLVHYVTLLLTYYFTLCVVVIVCCYDYLTIWRCLLIHCCYSFVVAIWLLSIPRCSRLRYHIVVLIPLLLLHCLIHSFITLTLHSLPLLVDVVTLLHLFQCYVGYCCYRYCWPLFGVDCITDIRWLILRFIIDYISCCYYSPIIVIVVVADLLRWFVTFVVVTLLYRYGIVDVVVVTLLLLLLLLRWYCCPLYDVTIDTLLGIVSDVDYLTDDIMLIHCYCCWWYCYWPYYLYCYWYSMKVLLILCDIIVGIHYWYCYWCWY